MAKSINNMDELEKALQPVLLGMVNELTERVYQTLNQLIKKGMFPIGCGINPKSGGFFVVFYGTKGYFNTLDLIALENKQKEQMQE